MANDRFTVFKKTPKRNIFVPVPSVVKGGRILMPWLLHGADPQRELAGPVQKQPFVSVFLVLVLSLSWQRVAFVRNVVENMARHTCG